jgi:hypothetical protein
LLAFVLVIGGFGSCISIGKAGILVHLSRLSRYHSRTCCHVGVFMSCYSQSSLSGASMGDAQSRAQPNYYTCPPVRWCLSFLFFTFVFLVKSFLLCKRKIRTWHNYLWYWYLVWYMCMAHISGGLSPDPTSSTVRNNLGHIGICKLIRWL